MSTPHEDLPAKIDEEIAALEEQKIKNLQVTNKSAYIKERVFKYKELWWSNFEKDLERNEDGTPKDKDLYRTAFIEYNKLQGRILPTEITGPDGDQLILNIVGYGARNNLLPKSVDNNEDGEENNE